MRDTQLDAWDDLQETVAGKRQRVLVAIQESKNHGATLFELSNILNWPINRVSGRVTELSKLGLIVDSKERRINPSSGKKGIVWRSNNE